jgi:putative DNA primase/helicase
MAALKPHQYEAERRRAAKALGFRAPVLDAMVQEARERVADRTGIIFPEVSPHPSPVDGAQLLDDILATLRQYIVADAETHIATTLWIAMSWFIDDIQVAPLAVITAPEKRCGKSQLLDFIGRLSRRPIVASNITSAALFRVIEAHGPTLLIVSGAFPPPSWDDAHQRSFGREGG